MLGKLIKYELNETARILVPSFLVWIGIVIMTKISILCSNSSSWAEEIFLPITMIILSLSSIVVSVIMIVIIVSKFYKSTLGNNGYLTFTLPVKTESIVFSKLTVASIWIIIMLIFSLVGSLILMAGDEMEIILEAVKYLTCINTSSIICLIIYMILSCVFEIIAIYTAISIASLFNRHRVILSFAFYFVIEMISSALNYFYGLFVGINTQLDPSVEIVLENEELTDEQLLQIVDKLLSSILSLSAIIPYIIFTAIMIIGLFFITSNILKKHLNLH